MWYKKLHNQIFAGIVMGVLLGVLSPLVAEKLRFIGDLFVSALKMLIAPLILSSIFVGISSLGDVRKLGSLGKQTTLYYLSTTFLAVLIGLLVVNVIQPGKGEQIEISEKHYISARETLKLNDADIKRVESINAFNNEKAKALILPLKEKKAWKKFHKNSFESELRNTDLSEGEISSLMKQVIDYVNGQKILEIIATLKARGIESTNADVKKTITAVNTEKTMGGALYDVANKMLSNPFKSLSEGDPLGIILFALLFGAIATMIGDSGKPVINFMNGFNDIMFKIVDLVITIAPVGVFSLIAVIVGENAASSEKLSQLAVTVGSYMLTVLIGLLIHGLIVLPLLLRLFGKMSPIQFFLGMRSALLCAFTTCTSGGTLPLTFKATQHNLKLSKKVTDFVLPLGATINMDGTALYESVAVIFIANFLGIDLTFVDQLIIFVTASIAAIGAATIPSAGLITMTIVLSAVGLPTSGIVIIMAVDRFLDMFRTTVNVTGDAVGSAIISKLQEKTL